MGEALFYGLLAGLPLIAGGAVALAWPLPERALGLVMGFGAGVLIAAVSYELVLEAAEGSTSRAGPTLGFFAGVAAFALGDAAIDRLGGEHRKSMSGAQAEGTPLAIVLGIVLDGVPESAVIGMSLIGGAEVSAAVLVAVAISNLPEAVSATAGLAAAGHRPRAIMGLWGLVTAVTALASLAGFVLLDGASDGVVAFVLAFAGGAILTMLADTMMPQAFEHGGRLAGIVTAVGFAVSFGITFA